MAERDEDDRDLEEPVAGAGDGDDDDLDARHRRERKELQAKLMALKKAVPKGDKKKKKEAQDQSDQLEQEMEKRHAAEKAAAAVAAAASTKKVDAAAAGGDAAGPGGDDDADADEATGGGSGKKNKAQKRREQREAEERERRERIAKSGVKPGESKRDIEYARLRTALTPQGLAIAAVRPDGHCLFASVLRQAPDAADSVLDLRARVADHMLAHADDYIFFLSNKDGSSLTPADYAAYCHEMATTAVWGGQPETLALARLLGRPIEVFQAVGPMQVVGDVRNAAPVRISYHRHEFGLGSHYNAVLPAEEVPAAAAAGGPDDEYE